MAALTPMLVLLVLGVGLGVVARRRSGRRRTSSRPHAATRAAPEPVRRPIQLVAADLRRLSRQMALVPAGAPLVRWKALWTAYDAVLAEAAEQLEVSHELSTTCLGTPRDIERLRVLTALETAGLVVRG
jgi:hypothetical protein